MLVIAYLGLAVLGVLLLGDDGRGLLSLPAVLLVRSSSSLACRLCRSPIRRRRPSSRCSVNRGWRDRGGFLSIGTVTITPEGPGMTPAPFWADRDNISEPHH